MNTIFLDLIASAYLLEAGNRREGIEKLVTVPINERLPIPDIKDINGHWAQSDIERLLSLKVLNPGGSIFGPGVNMTAANL